jgi:hypothetical protein
MTASLPTSIYILSIHAGKKAFLSCDASKEKHSEYIGLVHFSDQYLPVSKTGRR